MDEATDRFQLSVGRRRRSTQVLSFRGVESVNALYRFDICIAIPRVDASGFIDDVLEMPACLTLRSGLGDRAVHGLIGAITAVGDIGQDLSTLEVRLVPRLATLSLRKRTRIFQDSSTPEIVTQILDARAISYRMSLQREYAKRVYCVQYDETDLAFIERLLREEGIFTFFDHSPTSFAGAVSTAPHEASEVWVLADSAHAYEKVDGDPVLLHRGSNEASGMEQKEHHAHSFRLRSSLRPKGIFLRSFDMLKPPLEKRDLASRQAVSARHARGEEDAAKLQLDEGLTLYEHEGSREQARVLPTQASVVLEQERARAIVARGTGSNPRMVPGRLFSMSDHELDTLNAEYAIMRVEHRGRRDGGNQRPVYENRFRCVPRAVPLRPKRSSVRPHATTETAIVVAPAGHDIHTDELGRVKVQFHWDLDGTRDEKSSCWLRVAQAWAGARFGMQFIPRVGMEVLVSFVGGDPDRPVVTGCLYNGIAEPPFDLPLDKTKSGLRTRSSPGGRGANELYFEDKAGEELIRLRAELDMREDVIRHRETLIGGSETTRVGQSASLHVAARQEIQIGESQHTAITGDERRQVGGSVLHEIGGRVSTHAQEDISIRSDASAVVSLGHAAEVTIGGARGDGQLSVDVIGSSTSTTTKDLILSAGSSITLLCGTSTIKIAPDRITLTADHLELEGAVDVEVASKKGPILTLGERAEILAKKVAIFAENASIELDQEAKIRGTMVKLNYDPSKPTDHDPAKPQATKPFRLKLSDAFLSPHRKKKYHLTAGGIRIEGETDAQGCLSCEIPDSATSVQIRVWLRNYPDGPRREYSIELKKLEPATSVLGAKDRLKNLGYFHGRIDPLETEELAAAIADFQDDHKDSHSLEITGQNDGPTSGALIDVHGS